MFHYRSGIFILFLWGHNFFPPFFRFPCLSLHSLYCLFSRIQLEVLCFPHKNFMTLQQIVETQNTQAAPEETAGQTNRDTKGWRNEEGKHNGDIFTCHLKSFPHVTGSGYLPSRERVVLHVPALPICAPIWCWWATSYKLNGSQQPCSICLVSDWGRIGVFWGSSKRTSDMGGDGIVHYRLIRFDAITVQS